MRPLGQLVSLALFAMALIAGCREQQSQSPSTVSGTSSALPSDTGRTLDDAIASGGEVGDAPLSPDTPAGDTYAAQGRVYRGRRCFERGKRRGDGEADHVELHQAIAEYSKAIELDPTLADAYCGRGDVDLELGQAWLEDDIHRANSALQDAVADYTKAIELDPNNLAAHFGRGSTHRTLGEYGLAMADFERALALDPGSETARSRIAELKEEAGLSE